MNVLALSTWYPYPADNGSRLRAFHLLRELAKRHRVRVVAGLQDDYAGGHPQDAGRAAVLAGHHPDELTAFCESVRAVPWKWFGGGEGGPLAAMRTLVTGIPRAVAETLNPEMTAAIAEALTQPTDALLVLQFGMDGYLPADLPPGLPRILDEAEVSGVEKAHREQAASGGVARLRADLTYQSHTAYLRARFARYDALTAASEDEATAVRAIVGGGTPIAVIPNGVETKAYPERSRGAILPGAMIYNGALTYGPNREAVSWFTRDILPEVRKRIPGAFLTVTGKYDPAEAVPIAECPGVRLTGFLPDLRPTLAASAVCVVPLRSGGGTRLKILEAWAAGVPVVSTTIGAAGLGAEDGVHLLLADDAQTFADAAVRLLSDPALQDRLVENARRYARERFDWQAIGRDLSDLLEETAARKR